MWRNVTQIFWEDVLKELGKICWQKHKKTKYKLLQHSWGSGGAVRPLVGCRSKAHGKIQGWSPVSPGYFKVLKV